MCDKTKRLDCDLVVKGTDEANVSAEQDLDTPDPDKEHAKAILNKAMGKVDEEKKDKKKEGGQKTA